MTVVISLLFFTSMDLLMNEHAGKAYNGHLLSVALPGARETKI
jgi:hypothetical protein